MKEIIVGDIHLSENPRDDYRHKFQKWLRKFARQTKPDRIVLMGDLTEAKDRHPAILVNKVVDHVFELAKIAPVVCLQGNHDYAEEGAAFFEFLQRIPNTLWIRKPTALDDGLFLPHTPNHHRDWADVDLESKPTLYFHATFSGADLGGGVQARDGLPRKLIPKRAAAFAGDVHYPSESGNLIYVGAPYTVDFGDSYKSSVIYRAGPRYDRVDTSHLAQKRAIYLRSDERSLRARGWSKGDIAQVTVEVDNMEGWPKLIKKLRAEADEGELRIWAIKPKLLAKAAKRQHRVVDKGSDEDLLETFAKRQGLEERTLKAGKRLL